MAKFNLKDFWKKTVGKFVIITGFIAGLATLLGNISSIQGFFEGLLGNKGVQLVDLTISNKDTIDIKLRNNGKEVAFLKTVQLDFKKSWKIFPDGDVDFMRKEPSAVYNISIDSRKKTPFTMETSISQEIKPNETDRFQLSLYNNLHDDNSYVYLVDMKILIDENNTTITKPNLLLAFELPSQHYRKLNQENIKSITEINSINGYKSPSVIDLIGKVRLH